MWREPWPREAGLTESARWTPTTGSSHPNIARNTATHLAVSPPASANEIRLRVGGQQGKLDFHSRRGGPVRPPGDGPRPPRLGATAPWPSFRHDLIPFRATLTLARQVPLRRAGRAWARAGQSRSPSPVGTANAAHYQAQPSGSRRRQAWLHSVGGPRSPATLPLDKAASRQRGGVESPRESARLPTAEFEGLGHRQSRIAVARNAVSLALTGDPFDGKDTKPSPLSATTLMPKRANDRVPAAGRQTRFPLHGLTNHDAGPAASGPRIPGVPCLGSGDQCE